MSLHRKDVNAANEPITKMYSQKSLAPMRYQVRKGGDPHSKARWTSAGDKAFFASCLRFPVFVFPKNLNIS